MTAEATPWEGGFGVRIMTPFPPPTEFDALHGPLGSGIGGRWGELVFAGAASAGEYQV